MKLTKYSHSCVRLENNNKILVLDPGTLSEVEEALEGADYLFITHAHPDHFDAERVNAYLTEHPEVKVYAPETVAAQIREAVSEVEVNDAAAEKTITLEGFDIKTFGGQHALIHPLVPTIDNVGYLINEDVYHPGDSLVVPHGISVKTLLTPIHAPWNKIQEVIDFMISVKASIAYPIHNGLLSDAGHSIIEGQLKNFGKKYGTDYQHLNAGNSVEL